MNPASSAFLFSPQKTAIIGPFMAAPCKASTTGVGRLTVVFLGNVDQIRAIPTVHLQSAGMIPRLQHRVGAQEGGNEKGCEDHRTAPIRHFLELRLGCTADGALVGGLANRRVAADRRRRRSRPGERSLPAFKASNALEYKIEVRLLDGVGVAEGDHRSLDFPLSPRSR